MCILFSAGIVSVNIISYGQGIFQSVRQHFLRSTAWAWMYGWGAEGPFMFYEMCGCRVMRRCDYALILKDVKAVF